MDLPSLAEQFPLVWHATFAGGWSGIQKAGLRSSLDLLAVAGRADEAKAVRSDVVRLVTDHGVVALRNQVPNRKDPAPCLDGITVAEWWVLLNGRCYLFGDRAGLDRLVDSYLRQGVTQEVITFDTLRLLAPVVDHVEVATVNAGVFPRKTGPSRGRSTFQPLSEFSAPARTIKEITVTSTIPVNKSAVINVQRLTSGQAPPIRLWPSADGR